MPVGMTTQDAQDGESDNEALASVGLKAVNPRPNPWRLNFGTMPLPLLDETGAPVQATWSTHIWDIQMDLPRFCQLCLEDKLPKTKLITAFRAQLIQAANNGQPKVKAPAAKRRRKQAL
jgi:hypothetical protein